MLSEKIGQMLLVGFKGTVLSPDALIVDAILNRRIGGVILFAYNVVSPTQLAELTGGLQALAKQAGSPPLWISIDYEGGQVNRLAVDKGFPQTYSAATWSQLPHDKIVQCAEQMAGTLSKAGVNLNFAPVLDVNINLQNPIIGKRERSFSSDSQVVVEYATLLTKAYRDKHIVCAYKHFPGHGSSTGDTHLGFVEVTDTWQDCELNPYRELLPLYEQDVMVMTSHVVHAGLDAKRYPASLSRVITQDLLRHTIKYQGVVVTDDLQMRAITDNYGLAEAVTLAVAASADLLVFGNQLSSEWQNPSELIDIIEQGVHSESLPVSTIDDAYRRLMQLKQVILP